MISTTAIFLAFMPRICRERFVVMPNSATSRASVEDSSTTSTTKGGHFGIYYIVQKHSNLAKMVTFFHAPFMFQHCTRLELGVYKLNPDSVVWHTAVFPNRFCVKFIRGVTLLFTCHIHASTTDKTESKLLRQLYTAARERGYWAR